MLELLAAIQAAEPISLVLWAVVAFAAGMYPVGVMLGSSCSQCCTDCGCEPQQTLPEYVTADFSGLAKSTYNPTSLLSLSITSDFGSGAAGTVTGPIPGTGPIEAVTLTSSGSGYAVLDRVAPTITATCPPGTGATFSVTTMKVDDPVPYWKVTGVSVSGGTGYNDGDPLAFAVAGGDTAQQHAQAHVVTVRDEPSLTAAVSSGTGADLTVVVSQKTGLPLLWQVDGATVEDGGSGYVDYSPITFTPGNRVVTVTQATGYIRTGTVEPTLAADAVGSGSDAVLSVQLSSFYADGADEINERLSWQVSGITVVNGGSGYESGDFVSITVTDGDQIYGFSPASATVSSVDGNGAILAVTVDSAGAYFRDSGEIRFVVMNYYGEYFHDTGVPQSVVVDDGGIYYREDQTLPVLVATVTASISQLAPSSGSGAVITATIDTDKESTTFGQITALTLTNPGSGYRGWDFEPNATDCCGDWWNDTTFTLRRASWFEATGYPQQPGDVGCWYVSCDEDCCRWVKVLYRGQTLRPLVYTGPLTCSGCSTTFYGNPDDAPFLCDGLSFTATDPFGATVAIAATEQSCESASGQCPACCCALSTDEATNLASSGCTEAECSTQWISECVCGICGNLPATCPDTSLLVTATLELWSAAGPPYEPVEMVDSKEATFALNSGNDFYEIDGDDVASAQESGQCGVEAAVYAAFSQSAQDSGPFEGGIDFNAFFVALPSRRAENGSICPSSGVTGFRWGGYAAPAPPGNPRHVPSAYPLGIINKLTITVTLVT